jgi:hypothetical protein
MVCALGKILGKKVLKPRYRNKLTIVWSCNFADSAIGSRNETRWSLKQAPAYLSD